MGGKTAEKLWKALEFVDLCYTIKKSLLHWHYMNV